MNSEIESASAHVNPEGKNPKAAIKILQAWNVCPLDGGELSFTQKVDPAGAVIETTAACCTCHGKVLLDSLTVGFLLENSNGKEQPSFVETTEIPGLLVCKRPTVDDERGFFREAIELRDYERALKKKIDVVQWNHSRSHSGVIRGFHAEPWDKIIYVPDGNVMAAIADFRTDSPTFGKVLTFQLGDENRQTLYVPQGLANSFCALGGQDANYMYLVTAYYAGKPTPIVAWNDPILTSQFGGWPVENPIMSPKDKDIHNPTLKEKFGNQVDFSKFPWLSK